MSKLHVDLFKLSHHGSRQNMTDGLLDLIDPGAVLVCTDGSKFRHPDEDALQKIRSHYPDVPIHFTDDTDHIRQRAATVGAVPPLVLPLQLDFGTPSTGADVDRAEDAAAPTGRAWVTPWGVQLWCRGWLDTCAGTCGRIGDRHCGRLAPVPS